MLAAQAEAPRCLIRITLDGIGTMIARDPNDPRFETTRWTLIEALRTGGDGAEAALADLAWRYHGPVRAFIRRQTACDATADDLAQGFFADVVLWRNLFAGADAAKGKLRTLVLAALKRYLIDVRRKALVRPDHSRAVELDGADGLAIAAPGSRGTASSLENSDLEREWVLSLIDEAHRRTRDHFCGAGRLGHWSLFEARVVNPACRAFEPPRLESIYAQHGFSSSAQAAAAVQTVRERFKAILFEIVAKTADKAEDHESDYALLREALGA